MKHSKLTTLVLPCLLLSACGSGDALDAVEQAADSINTTITDLSTAVNDGIQNITPDETVQSDPGTDDTPTIPASPTTPFTTTTPQIDTRPETFEDYQYLCNAFSNPDNSWVWGFRPDFDMADQFNLVTGTWEWVDNLQILIRPQGNPEVLGTLNSNDNNSFFLENWGICTLRFGRSLTEQFTRPN